MFIGKIYFAVLSKVKFFKYERVGQTIKKSIYSEFDSFTPVYENGNVFYDIFSNKKYSFSPSNLKIGEKFIDLNYGLFALCEKISCVQGNEKIKKEIGINPTKRKIKKLMKIL